jgi:hypothetical protein
MGWRTGAEIHRKLSSQCGNNISRQQSVYEWIIILKNLRKIAPSNTLL